MTWMQSIIATPEVLHGTVRFAGTRIPVTVVLANLAAGASRDDILRQYPSLTS